MIKPLLFFEARRKIYPWVFIACSDALSRKSKFGTPLRSISRFDGDQGVFYYICDDYEKQYSGILDNFISNPKSVKRFIDESKKATKPLNRKIKNPENMSNKELYHFYKRFYAAFVKSLKAQSILRIIDRAGSQKLKDMLKEKNVTKDDDAMFTLCTTEKDSYIAAEENALLKAAMEVKISKKPKRAMLIKDMAKALLKKYGWVSMGWYDEPMREIGYYEERLLKLSKDDLKKATDEMMIKKEKSIIEREELIRRLNLSRKELSLVRLMQESVFLKDYIKGCFAKFMPEINKFFSEILKRSGFTEKEVKSMAFEELESFLLKDIKPDRREIDERMKYCVIYGEPNENIKIFIGKDADKLWGDLSRYLPKIEWESVELKGRTASKGRGKGNVRIVMGQEDVKNFRQGEILVATTTTPDFVPAMKKAAAIVTEEGGLTCHAAVVSRELRVPCVVGIADATLIFKDGDLVEVDADKGVVRKIR